MSVLARRRTQTAKRARVYVGSFTKLYNAVGNQSFTGLGFQPKAILFFTADCQDTNATENVYEGRAATCLGITSGVGEDACVASTVDGAFTSVDTWADVASYGVYCLTHNSGQGARNWRATLVSFDPDGFTINHGFNGSFDGRINFIAFGGEGVEAKVVTWQGPTAVGPKAITGAGFEPDVAITLSAPVNFGAGTTTGGISASNVGGTGIAVATPTAAAASFWAVNGGTLESGDIDAAYAAGVGSVLTGNVGGVYDAATLTSMDADGMTLDFVTVGTLTTASPLYHTLFLKGYSVAVGTMIREADDLSSVGLSGAVSQLGVLAFGSLNPDTSYGARTSPAAFHIGAASSPTPRYQRNSSHGVTNDGHTPTEVISHNHIGSLIDGVYKAGTLARRHARIHLDRRKDYEESGLMSGWDFQWTGVPQAAPVRIGLAVFGEPRLWL